MNVLTNHWLTKTLRVSILVLVLSLCVCSGVLAVVPLVSVQLLAQQMRFICCPVSVHRSNEACEVGVHGCRYIPEFQHILVVSFVWAPVTGPGASFIY